IVELDCELERRTADLAPALLELPGCGALTAAKLLAEVGPIDRFNSDAQLARHSGVAPLEASSGRVQRHRLDRGGNRQLNAAFYRMAITPARYHPPARAYLERKQAEGKSRREAIRCLKRLLTRRVFNTLKASPALTKEQLTRTRPCCRLKLRLADDRQRTSDLPYVRAGLPTPCSVPRTRRRVLVCTECDSLW